MRKLDAGGGWNKRVLRGVVSESLISYNKNRGWFLNVGGNWKNFWISGFIGECRFNLGGFVGLKRYYIII
jgi:hypothetical protein